MKVRCNSTSSSVARTATRRQIMVGAIAACGGLTLGRVDASAAGQEEISRSEAIHQEPAFNASRKRVYEALTDARQFDKVVHLSTAMQSMTTGARPTEISREVGGAFTLFGGQIVGRHLELVPNERIVQAWRDAGWNPGAYSIVKFEFVQQGSGTKIVFDHRGFPDGRAERLAYGWNANYWEPLTKYLG